LNRGESTILRALKLFNSQSSIKNISNTLKRIIATNVINNGRIPIYNETRMALFHCSDPDSISFVETKMIRAIIASTPYAGRPMGVVMEITPGSAEDVTVVVATVIVVDIILISIVITSNI